MVIFEQDSAGWVEIGKVEVIACMQEGIGIRVPGEPGVVYDRNTSWRGGEKWDMKL